MKQRQDGGRRGPHRRFGLDGRDVQAALRRFARHPKTVGAEIVEISPPGDVADLGANRGAALALNFFMGAAEREA